VNVALRAIYEGLVRAGDPVRRWDLFVGAVAAEASSNPFVGVDTVRAGLRSSGISASASASEWLGNLHTLGVIDGEGALDASRASDVGRALSLVGDSFAVPISSPTWAPVATLPSEVRTLLRPPPFRQTAGVMLGLIDRSVASLTLAAPFVDGYAVDFLRDSVATAMRRGVKVDVLTSGGRGVEMRPLVDDALRDSRCRLTVTELETVISSLGSHAKVLLVDGRDAYVGSANLTTAGLGRHVEIGVELSGPQVDDLVRLFAALERLGRRVFNVADGQMRN
jgi:hypothetical protein